MRFSMRDNGNEHWFVQHVDVLEAKRAQSNETGN